jgi:transcriptional regulator with XRE-family HTH domain
MPRDLSVPVSERVKAFGERLRAAVKDSGVRQVDLAKACSITEVTLSRYVNGQRMPRYETVCALAKELHTTPEYLTGNEEVLDPESDYYRLHRMIERMRGSMTEKQKRELVYAILEDKNDSKG